MNIFLKAQVTKYLEAKVAQSEIRSYSLNENKLHIQKSKRCKHTLDIKNIPGHILIRLLQKRIPDPSITNTGDFFTRELRELKIKDIIN